MIRAWPSTAPTVNRFPGSAEQIAEDVRAFQAVGVSEIVFDFRSPTLAESLDRMTVFSEGVMPIVD